MNSNRKAPLFSGPDNTLLIAIGRPHSALRSGNAPRSSATTQAMDKISAPFGPALATEHTLSSALAGAVTAKLSQLCCSSKWRECMLDGVSSVAGRPPPTLQCKWLVALSCAQPWIMKEKATQESINPNRSNRHRQCRDCSYKLPLFSLKTRKEQTTRV